MLNREPVAVTLNANCWDHFASLTFDNRSTVRGFKPS